MERALIREAEGNLLTADVEALVNTVNTVGVMGKGIALQFKRAYPAMFAAYRRAARAGDIRVGRMHVWETGALEGPRLVINFPTKEDWRSPSRLNYVREGLDDLARVIEARNIRSIALPPLGCGNGGLRWDDVKPLVIERLGGLPVDVVVYPPHGAPPAQAMVEHRERPTLTAGRKALLGIMVAYQEATFEAPSVVEVQKLMYFLQQAGQPLQLTYAKGQYGPYADRLRHVLADLEGHYILGFGDGSARVNEAEPLQLLEPGHEAAASADLDEASEARVRRVLELTEGYSSAYGLELLASTHWIATREVDDPADAEEVVDRVRAWTPRKGRLFSRDHLHHAWWTLNQRGWLRAVQELTPSTS